MVDDGQGEGDALRGWLGGVVDGGDPSISLAEELVAGEQGASVTIGAAAEEKEIENRETDRVTGGETGDEGLFVLVGQLLEVVEVGDVDGMDLGLFVGGKLIEQFSLKESIVGVGVVEGNGALVGEKNLPLGEVDDVVGTGGWAEKSLGEGFGEGAARDSNFEGTVAGDASVLALDHIGAKGRGESVNAGEGEEVWLSFAHCDCVWRMKWCKYERGDVLICRSKTGRAIWQRRWS